MSAPTVAALKPLVGRRVIVRYTGASGATFVFGAKGDTKLRRVDRLEVEVENKIERRTLRRSSVLGVVEVPGR